MRAVFDPNPAWKDLELGAVERLSWHNAMGVETFGDLVLPPNYRPGTRLPLIVVQYESRGLLRGGTADDYPIQLYAAHGFAVLSFNRPPWSALQGPPRPLGDFLRANQRDWSDRRSVQSSLETIIAQLAARGIIDPAKVGITGQSDGASTATFALIHSKLFAAAAISTCCEDANIMSSLGSGFADFYHTTGYPLAGDPAPGFWSESALALHADHHPVPLLIQASDQEVRMALPTYATLKNAGWPIEMYVFPGEAHVKFQPAHRLAVYERSLAWFERWLQPGGPEGQTAMSLLPDDGPSAYGQDAAHASTSAN
jgi:dipeptidyl aminopeptidase/acylaminoacyl peptidase